MKLDDVYAQIVRNFETRSGLAGLEWSTVPRHESMVLLIYVAFPTERLYALLNQVVAEISADGAIVTATLKSYSGDRNLIDSPEGRFLLKNLSETLNVNRFTFQNDFFSRYTSSVAGAEAQITAKSNHVILGRRGAGKSMLMLYAWHSRRAAELPSVWIDMQVYSGRGDVRVLLDVLADLTEQASEAARLDTLGILDKLNNCPEDIAEVRKILPVIRRHLSVFGGRGSDLFLFLDDFHVVDISIQPILMDVIYAVCRGNQVYIKASAIETLTKTYDSATSQGVQIPQDAQNIKLDYNLTMPDKAASHIEAILDSHATHAGIKSIRRLCVSADVVPRLTWVAAGVPRDALNLFAQAMLKASLDARKRVSVSNVNLAASETLTIKLREMETDASERAARLKEMIDKIKNFCVADKRTNSFLVEIGTNSEAFDTIQNLVHLRLLHVITEGITVGDAGRKFMGLILDYGFYTGIRAAQSVDLFNKRSHKVTYKELRGLPIFVP